MKTVEDESEVEETEDAEVEEDENTSAKIGVEDADATYRERQSWLNYLVFENFWTLQTV